MDYLKEAINAFQLGSLRTSKRITTGHINHTFCVETEKGRFVVQSVNTHVFPSVPILMGNSGVYLEYRTISDITCPHYCKTTASDLLFIDPLQQAWRAYPWIEGRVLKQVSRPQEAYACGFAYGQFNRSAMGVPLEKIQVPIDGFFDLKQRLYALDQAIKKADPLRLKKIEPLLKRIASHRDHLLQAWLFGDQHHLPKRCIHADTKPTNVLFHPTASQAVAVIDLDMIAPYYLYYDFADGVRSTANAADESGSNAHIDLALLRAFAQGFLEPLHDLLTRGEKESLVRTLPCVSFMLTVRFATDYCENDRYFRVDDAEHNVRRAEAQYRITEDLMRSDVLKCVREICF